MPKEGVARISISMPPNLLRELDKTISRMDYDRSKAVQVAVRNFLTEYKWVHEAKNVTGALIMVYDHTVRGLEEALTDVQHDYNDVIASSMHVHLDEINCLEIIAVKGKARRIKGLADRLLSRRGVKQLRPAVVTV